MMNRLRILLSNSTCAATCWYHPLAEEHKLYVDLEAMGRLRMVS